MQPDRATVSIVVPAYQAEATIGPCVHALAAQIQPCDEIIVVDDGSSDRTAAQASAAGARVIRLETNRGPAAARNAGVHRAHGDLVVFTDADCEAAPDFVAKLVAPMVDERICGAKGAYLTRQRSIVATFVQCEYEQRYRHAAAHEWLDFVDTSACCFRRKEILQAGGFDTELRVCEDQELSFRLSKAGVRIVFTPEARTYHHHCERPVDYVRKKFRIARWKVQVLRRHPDKALHDSHTPQTLKLQIGLAYALALVAAGSPRWSWRPAATVLCLYLAVAAPFLMRIAARGQWVWTLAPALLLVRDLALGAGLLTGVGDVVRNKPCGS
jgi:cellulose synthase/poly-beta-1,6-N-acetylglucosamine synthase-like glycosyltransferase